MGLDNVDDADNANDADMATGGLCKDVTEAGGVNGVGIELGVVNVGIGGNKVGANMGVGGMEESVHDLDIQGVGKDSVSWMV